MSRTPLTDAACFHATALKFYQDATRDGLRGFCNVWAFADRVHTPLVPALSSIAMHAFGDSPRVIESVLPLFLFIFIVSTMLAVRAVYDDASAYAAAALVATFPVVLNLSRIYLLELPFAALVVAACACMLRSNGFRKFWPTLGFGAFAGLAALARAGGPALLLGPWIVYMLINIRGPGIGRAIVNLLAAAAVGGGLAATWYAPNWSYLQEYLHSVTYGSQAGAYVEGDSPYSIENAEHYAAAVLYEGPGVPLAAIALGTFIVNIIRGRFSAADARAQAALFGAFFLTFLTLMTVAQRCGSVLFVSAMPILALGVVRSIANVERAPYRRVLAAAAAGIAIFGAVDTTLLFPLPPVGSRGAGPFGADFPLWSHRSMVLDLAGPDFTELSARFRLAEVAAKLDALELPNDSPIYVMAHHSFANANGIQLACVRKWRRFFFKEGELIALVGEKGRERWVAESREYAMRARAVIVRSNAPPDLATELYQEVLAPLVSRAQPRFVVFGGPVEASDGSSIHVYRRTTSAASAPAPK